MSLFFTEDKRFQNEIEKIYWPDKIRQFLKDFLSNPPIRFAISFVYNEIRFQWVGCSL